MHSFEALGKFKYVCAKSNVRLHNSVRFAITGRETLRTTLHLIKIMPTGIFFVDNLLVCNLSFSLLLIEVLMIPGFFD